MYIYIYTHTLNWLLFTFNSFYFFHYSWSTVLCQFPTLDWFTTLCQFLLYSKATQSYRYKHYFSHIVFRHVLSIPRETGYRFLCCAVIPHCLSILNIIVRVCQLQTPSPSPSLLEILSNDSWERKENKRLLNAKCQSLGSLFSPLYYPTYSR